MYSHARGRIDQKRRMTPFFFPLKAARERGENYFRKLPNREVQGQAMTPA
jgi:hypothetical protein